MPDLLAQTLGERARELPKPEMQLLGRQDFQRTAQLEIDADFQLHPGQWPVRPFSPEATARAVRLKLKCRPRILDQSLGRSPRHFPRKSPLQRKTGEPYASETHIESGRTPLTASSIALLAILRA